MEVTVDGCLKATIRRKEEEPEDWVDASWVIIASCLNEVKKFETKKYSIRQNEFYEHVLKLCLKTSQWKTWKRGVNDGYSNAPIWKRIQWCDKWIEGCHWVLSDHCARVIIQ